MHIIIAHAYMHLASASAMLDSIIDLSETSDASVVCACSVSAVYAMENKHYIYRTKLLQPDRCSAAKCKERANKQVCTHLLNENESWI
jgi:hypothetical protein